MAPQEQVALNPKEQLIKFLGSPEKLGRTREAVNILLPDNRDYNPGLVNALFIRAILLQVPMAIPPADSMQELVPNMQKMGWRIKILGMEKPSPSDIYVVTSAQRSPIDMGFVAKVSTDGGFFYGASAHQDGDGRYQRIEIKEVDYLISLPGG